MNIQAIAASAASVAMGIVGPETKVTVTLRLGFNSATGVYDPATNSVAEGMGTAILLDKDANSGALKYRRKITRQPNSEMNDKEIAAYTHTLLILAADINGAEIVLSDTVVEGGTIYAFLAVDYDPTRSIWMLDCRR